MHDTKHGNDGEYFCFLDPGYQSGSKHLRRRIADLDYLDLQISADYRNCDDHIEGKGRGFRTNGQVIDGGTAYASPPWAAVSRDIVYEECPSRPYYDESSYLRSQRELQAAADAGNTLKELIEKVPESSYELSFSVFVNEQQSMEESGEAIMEEKQDWKSKGEIEKKNKNSRPKVLHRFDRDNSGNFLLKVSLPVSLPLSVGHKKKPKGSCLNLPTMNLREGSEKPVKKEWWKMLCSETSEVSVIDPESNSTGSSNSTNSSSRWLSESNIIPARGYFSSRSIRDCLFRLKRACRRINWENTGIKAKQHIKEVPCVLIFKVKQ